MATYRYQPVPDQLLLESRVIYGSSRVGIDGAKAAPLNVPAFNPSGVVQYELTDHLGNVAVTMTDELVAVDEGQDLNPANDYNGPVIVSAQGYEAGGSFLPGRNYSSSTYAYGFNGMRKDDEIHGASGTSYDFGARLYDARVGRWLSIDPLYKEYPAISSYTFALNNPIFFVDRDGKEVVAFDPVSQQLVIAVVNYLFGGGHGFAFENNKLVHGAEPPATEKVTKIRTHAA